MSSSKKLIIVCCGGFAREVHWLAQACQQEWTVVGFIDDTESLQGQTVCDSPVLGKIEDWKNFPDASFVVALGSPRDRKAIVEKMESLGKVSFATLIHPSVQYSKYVQFGEGTIVAAGCIITTHVTIGRHCNLNLGCTIGHDASFGDYCTLAPQAIISGNVTLGAGIEIGTGATLIEKISVGSGSFIGAGSIVTKTLPESGFFAGSPARQIRSIEDF